MFEAFTEFPVPQFEYPRETYKDYVAPILRMSGAARSTDPATFAMVPRKRIPPGVKVFDTMNARAESVGEKRSYSAAWKKLQLCLIPCISFYEPNYETGKPVRWSIGVEGGRPFAIAGLWRAWEDPDGVSLSFTMLTVNANEHPLMKRFHRPGDEKRSVVILRPEEYDDWLGARSTDEARSFLNLFPADQMAATAAPKPPKTAVSKLDDKSQGSLLG
ncbi:SOS response-associated peptidase family protein [Paraburkholderia sp. FT54]|uniref:SOS response-associated peptidase n=1 Tax=Paraburkholderia sp. FT54 TaxID=3074437 RepID=UPI002877F89D|nr:SOS response-associated peptidase family protein [Paraburkholderia sp. FT54]WNC90979.1 SOS response-associated peptidase family protein [Paraburkholderia sp. FT54]